MPNETKMCEIFDAHRQGTIYDCRSNVSDNYTVTIRITQHGWLQQLICRSLLALCYMKAGTGPGRSRNSERELFMSGMS